VHEKNVRHGQMSMLDIWPARRPLAACRAALIATLLPDPGDDEARKALLKRLAGTLSRTTKPKKMPDGRTEAIDARGDHRRRAALGAGVRTRYGLPASGARPGTNAGRRR
jgi:adenine-specific DNA methylase